MGEATHLRTEESKWAISRHLSSQSTHSSCSISITLISSINIRMSPLMTRQSLMMQQIIRTIRRAIRWLRMKGSCNIIKTRLKICQLLNSDSNHLTINSFHARVQWLRLCKRIKWSRKFQFPLEPKQFQIIMLKVPLNKPSSYSRIRPNLCQCWPKLSHFKASNNSCRIRKSRPSKPNLKPAPRTCSQARDQVTCSNNIKLLKNRPQSTHSKCPSRHRLLWIVWEISSSKSRPTVMDKRRKLSQLKNQLHVLWIHLNSHLRIAYRWKKRKPKPLHWMLLLANRMQKWRRKRRIVTHKS
jgi:hypothetical protein